MTGPARDSIEQVSHSLAALLRAGLARDGVAGTVLLGPARAGARRPARARLEVILHRAGADAAARQAPPRPAGTGGLADQSLAVQLGYLVLVRGPDAAAEQRALTSALRSVWAGPALGGAGDWHLVLEDVADETRLAVCAAARLPFGPCVWCAVRGVKV